MIIFGTREAQGGNKALSGHSCQYCDTKESLSVSVRAAYFHIFWIPVFPYRKKVYTVCRHCNQYLSRNEMPPDLVAKATRITADIGTRWYHFAGLILIGLLFVMGAITSIIND